MHLDLQYLLLPPETTPILQPIDVGIGRAFKSKIREYFHQYVIDNFKEVLKNGNMQSSFKNPSNETIIRWVLQANDHCRSLKIVESIFQFY